MQDNFGICGVSDMLVDVLAYLGTDLNAGDDDDPQEYSDVGLVTLPVTAAMPLLLDYMEECSILRGNASKLAYFDEHALEPCVKCFSHIVTRLLAQKALWLADLRNENLISMLRPGGPCIKPILLMLGKQMLCLIHPLNVLTITLHYSIWQSAKFFKTSRLLYTSFQLSLLHKSFPTLIDKQAQQA